MTAPLDQSDLVDRAQSLVEAARRAGADAADAVCLRGIAHSVDVRLGKVEETSRAEGDDFTLRAFVGRRNASVSANVFTDIDGLAERAVTMAKAAPEDPFVRLADTDRLAREFPDLDLFDPSLPDTDQLTGSARAAEDALRAVDGITNSEGASAAWSLGGLVLVTSAGFAGSYLASRFNLSASAIAGSGTGMERDYDWSSKTHLADLPAPEEIGRNAADRAIRRLGPGKATTGAMPIVFDRRVSRSLIGHLAGAANGAAIARRTSFLRESLGQRLFPAAIRITDDPHRPRGLASRPFDGEGVAAEAFDLVADGVLQGWLLDTASASELDLTTNGRAVRSAGGTSPGVTNLTLLPGDRTPEELIAAVGNGILVTELIGHGVNMVTGDYSRGAAGFRIVDGEIAEPVSEFTIAGNLRDIFAGLTVADDLEYRTSINAPTVAVEGLTVAGN